MRTILRRIAAGKQYFQTLRPRFRSILRSQEGDRRIPKRVSRHWNWIWFLGAAVWFFDAALGMHHGALGVGLADAGIAALFLGIGLFFRRQAKRQQDRGSQR